MSAEMKSRFRTGAKICSGVIVILLLVAALGPAKWAPRTELGWQFDHFIGYFGITLFFCFAWPRPIEKKMKKRGSRGFGRYLVAILIGVAATLAWQSYGDAAKQVIATKAPELGWSPEAKQMIASWTLGWTKPPASREKIAPETPAPSLDAAQVQRITQILAVVRETLQELAGSQRSMARDIARQESAVAETL